MTGAPLDLFPRPPADQEPAALLALAAGAVLSVSVSGGKDSQAMLSHLDRLRHRHRWAGHAEAVHADLGRAEWPQTPAHVETTTEATGLPLVVVRRDKGDLVDRIEDRLNTVSTIDPATADGGSRPAKPFWPSAAQRYCTSDLKRGPIQKHLRTHGKTALVVSAMGMRAAESHARARRPRIAIDAKVSASAYADLDPAEAVRAHLRGPLGRLVLSWQPIHDWSEARVWQELSTSAADLDRRRALHAAGRVDEALAGWRAHPAYALGNERLSCALCVLGSRSDLVNGAKHNPELAARYAALEAQTGYTFRADLAISDIIAEAEAS